MLTQKAIPKGNKTQGSQPQEIQRAPKPVPQLALGVDAQRTTGSSAHTFPDVHMPRAAPEKPQAGKKAQQQQQREKSQNPQQQPQPRPTKNTGNGPTGCCTTDHMRQASTTGNGTTGATPKIKTAQSAAQNCGSGRECCTIFPSPQACKSRIVSVILPILQNQLQVPQN